MEDHLVRINRGIDEDGWYLVCVEAGADTPGWLYTVGLSESFGHPELVLVGADLRLAPLVLEELCERVEDGERLLVGGDIDIGGRSVHIGPVHPAHLNAGLVSSWLRYYAALGAPPPPLEVMQVVLSDQWFCPCHQRRQVDLSSGRPMPGAGGVGRAERRRQERAARHRGGRNGEGR